MKHTVFPFIFSIPLITLLLLLPRSAKGALLINEFVTAASEDWVELFVAGDPSECHEISSYFVTMYYGSNEALATSPVTICARDRPETSYDDRYVLVWLTDDSLPDETDLTGDTNGNGVLDLRCDNYSNSLWNSEGVVALDSDDNPANGGIIDFVAYSNGDGSPHSTISSYVTEAIDAGQWGCEAGQGIQACGVDIGISGLEPTVSIARKNSHDTNGKGDFEISRYLTPGKENILHAPGEGKYLIRAETSRIVVSKKLAKAVEVPVFLYEESDVRMRLFSVTGYRLFQSPLMRDLYPGRHSFSLEPALVKKLPPGLYLLRLEAVVPSLRRGEEIILPCIVGR